MESELGKLNNKQSSSSEPYNNNDTSYIGSYNTQEMQSPATQRRAYPLNRANNQEKIKQNLKKTFQEAQKAFLKAQKQIERQMKYPQEVYVEIKDKLETEHGRKYRQTVYDFGAWIDHRKQTRYWNYASGTFGSRILFSIWQPCLLVTLVAITVGCYNIIRVNSRMPHWFPSLLFTTPEPLTITSFALSLLLVFRTNNCFQRYFEARALWGSLTNRSRDITRMAMTFFPKEDVQAKYTFARWAMAIPNTLLWHLRGETEIEEEVKHILTPEEIKFLKACPHKPVAAVQVISEVVQGTIPQGFQNMQLHNNVTVYHDVIGACERILRTPMPLSYTKHTCRFLLVWLILLPFNLWPRMGWSTVPLTLIIALLLLGIDEIGIQIEEPFGILPLEAMVERMERDILMMYKNTLDVQHMVSKILKAKDSYRDSLAYELTKESFEREVAMQRSTWREEEVELQTFIERTHQQVPKSWEGQPADFWKRDLPRDCW